MAAVIPLPHQRRLAFPEPLASFFGATGQDPAVDRPAPPEPRPDLRVIPGGPEAALRRRQRPEVYRRRRLVAAGLALAVMVTVAWLTVSVVALLEPEVLDGAVASTPMAAPPAATRVVEATVPVAAPASEAPASYLVQPGDTLWSIAESLAVGGDVRALVDELADRAGGASLEAGQRIDLDGLADVGG